MTATTTTARDLPAIITARAPYLIATEDATYRIRAIRSGTGYFARVTRDGRRAYEGYDVWPLPSGALVDALRWIERDAGLPKYALAG
jgi:hypothetical protein